MDDNIVAALAVFCIFGLPIAGLIISRAFRFIERLEMIKRGIVPPPNGGSRAWREWARQQQQQQQGGAPGTPWQQQGPIPAGWQQQYYTPTPQPAGCDDDAQRALFKGIRLALIGFAILIGLSFIGGTPGTPDFHGGPWLLGGLIPMFVGIAQVIIAVLSGAQLPGVTTQRFTPPPPPPPSGPGPTITPPGSGAWQQPPPRSRFEELSKPVQPPDLR